MAGETVSSNLYNSLTDPTASTAPPPDVGTLGGKVRIAVCLFDDLATASSENTDILKIAPLPSNARVISIQMSNTDGDAGDNNGTFDLGLYQDGTALDADVFVANGTTLQAASNRTELLDPVDLDADFGKRLWEQGDLSSDPGGLIDICLTFDSANIDQTIDIAFVIMYVVD